jgi:hypothetical protein
MSSKKIDKIKNENNHLADSIIDKISTKNLKPESKTSLKYKTLGLYLFIFLGLFLLSLVGVLSFNTFRRNLFLESSFGNTGINNTLYAIPWAPLIFAVVAMILLALFISKTEQGYKYRKLLLITFGFVFLSLVTGLFYIGGVRHGLANNYRLQNLDDKNQVRFHGRVIETRESSIILEDRPGDRLNVSIDDHTKCFPDDCNQIKLNQPIAGWAKKNNNELLASRDSN